MAHFIYPQATSTTAFVLDSIVVSPTVDSAVPANNKGMPVVNLAGEGLGPLDVNNGNATATTLRVAIAADSTISLEEDHGYGVVGANTFRTAAQIGNATGAAAFGSGADSAQTLRVTTSTRSETATTPLAVRLSDGTAFLANLPVSQSGTWNLNNISGTISLPTGAATESTLSGMSAKLPTTLGQTTMAGSLSVTMASNQTAIPVSGTITATNAANGTLGAAAPTVATQIAAQLGGNLQYLSATAGGLLKVDGSGVTQSVSGTVTASQTTAANLNATVVGTGTFAVQATQAGTWNLNNITGTVSLPTGAATETTLSGMSGKLPATLGQKVMLSSLAVAIASDQSAIPASQSGTWNINNVSGTISLPTGAATESTLSALNTKVTADFGASTSSIRTASLVGNATGAAAFNAGAASAQTLRVVLADESKPQVGLASVQVISRTYSTSNVTGTYSNLGSVLSAQGNMVAFFETGGTPLIVGWGSVDKFIIPPGGSESPLPILIPNGTQLQIKTADASTVSSGNFYMTVLG